MEDKSKTDGRQMEDGWKMDGRRMEDGWKTDVKQMEDGWKTDGRRKHQTHSRGNVHESRISLGNRERQKVRFSPLRI